MKKYIATFILIIVSLCIWLPLWLILSGSFMGNAELSGRFAPVFIESPGFASFYTLPMYPTLRGYVELLADTPKFFVMFWNSWKLVLPTLLGQLIVGIPCAWGFARYRFPMKKWIFVLYIVLMLMPFQVTMVSNYLVLDALNLLNTSFAIICPGIFSTFPVFILYRFFSQVDGAVLEAAEVDGANALESFLYIAVPLAKPGIISILLLGFLEYWNMLEQPLAFLRDSTLWPLSLYLPQIAWERAGVSLAASVIMILPALFCFLYGQSYLQQGINASVYKV